MASIITEFKQYLMRFGLEWFKRYYSFYDAKVVSNNDPQKIGRIQFDCAELNMNNQYWALPIGVYSGDGVGELKPPPIGARVYIRFKYGDVRFPYYEYGSWYKNEGIEDESSSYPNAYVLKTPQGQLFSINDSTNEIRMKLNSSNEVVISQSGIDIGSSDVKQPMVLGNNNKQALTDLQSVINSLNTTLTIFMNSQSAAASSAQILAPLVPAYQVANGQLTQLSAQITALTQSIEQTNSKKHKLD